MWTSAGRTDMLRACVYVCVSVRYLYGQAALLHVVLLASKGLPGMERWWVGRKWLRSARDVVTVAPLLL